MATLFFKVDSNKLCCDVENEQFVISAKFGKDLFDIFKVIGRKKVSPFFGLPGIYLLVYICLFKFASGNMVHIRQKMTNIIYISISSSGTIVPGGLTSTKCSI